MGTVSGMGTTYNLPNYHGELFQISPSDTPLLSAIGGLTGGQTTTSTAFEWQTKDLRAPSIRPRLEGADAPTAESRSRSNVENVVQIFQESVSTSYTKQAATGQYATPSSAPFYSADGAPNTVSPHAEAVADALVTMATDVNFTFWHGKKVKPTTNATARQAGGLLEAISTNKVGTIVSGLTTGASDTVGETGTGLANADRIVFVNPPAELRPDRAYYVVSKTTDAFKVSATSGGSALTIAASQTGISYVKVATTVTVDSINSLLRGVYDNGGLSIGETATMFVPSVQKVNVSKVYANEYGKADPLAGRNVGGVAVDAIVTDFGTLNIVIDRALPPDAIVVVSADQLAPVFLEVPGKGVLFEEELAKTGSADKTQIYGEIGLKWGNERSHGVLRGLTF